MEERSHKASILGAFARPRRDKAVFVATYKHRMRAGTAAALVMGSRSARPPCGSDAKAAGTWGQRLTWVNSQILSDGLQSFRDDCTFILCSDWFTRLGHDP